MAVLHYTDMPTVEAALQRLTDAHAQVSAHYLIARDGTVFALVDEGRRAWHAGASFWGGETDVNSRSIGVELDHPGESGPLVAFAEPQMRSLVALLDAVRARWSIPPEGVVGHSDVAPGRKIDPGWMFDWKRLAAAGHAAAPLMRDVADARPSDDGAVDLDALSSAFRSSLGKIGYGDWPDASLLDAFRRRFHQWTGRPSTPAAALTSSEAAVAAALARRYPVGRRD